MKEGKNDHGSSLAFSEGQVVSVRIFFNGAAFGFSMNIMQGATFWISAFSLFRISADIKLAALYLFFNVITRQFLFPLSYTVVWSTSSRHSIPLTTPWWHAHERMCIFIANLTCMFIAPHLVRNSNRRHLSDCIDSRNTFLLSSTNPSCWDFCFPSVYMRAANGLRCWVRALRHTPRVRH